jgi:hypothetical protein
MLVAVIGVVKVSDPLPPSHGATAPGGPGSPNYRGFTITLRHTTLDKTPLDEWSARRTDVYVTTYNTHKRQMSMKTPLDEWSARRTDVYVTTHNSHTRQMSMKTPLDEWSARRTDVYVTIHNTHKRQMCMPLAVFEPTIPASARPPVPAKSSDSAAKFQMFVNDNSFHSLVFSP